MGGAENLSFLSKNYTHELKLGLEDAASGISALYV